MLRDPTAWYSGCCAIWQGHCQMTTGDKWSETSGANSACLPYDGSSQGRHQLDGRIDHFQPVHAFSLCHAVEGLAAKTGDAFYPQMMPKDALGPNLPHQDIYVPGFVVCFFVDENLDEELIYNIVKTAIEHDDEFEGYLGPGYKGYATFMAAAALPGGESEWHSGAVKAYKEAGIKIGEWTE